MDDCLAVIGKIFLVGWTKVDFFSHIGSFMLVVASFHTCTTHVLSCYPSFSSHVPCTSWAINNTLSLLMYSWQSISLAQCQDIYCIYSLYHPLLVLDVVLFSLLSLLPSPLPSLPSPLFSSLFFSLFPFPLLSPLLLLTK